MSTLPQLTKSVMRRRLIDPAGAELPDREVTVADVTVDRDGYARYCRLTGFGLTGHLPTTYPHLLSFGSVMRLFTDPKFPYSPAGLLHVGERIDNKRPIPFDATLDVSTRLGACSAHRRGALFEVSTHVHQDGEIVWAGTSTYLVRAKHPGTESMTSATVDTDDLGPADLEALWKVNRDTGRRYAAISGDYNPVHLNRLTAAGFGMKRPIAHGMWSLARCLGAMSQRIPDRAQVEVRFRRPLPLPTARVALLTRRQQESWRFALATPSAGQTYLSGSVTHLDPPGP